jgi:hypothetical protein
MLDELPSEFAPNAIPNNKLAPYLVKRGVAMERYARADVSVSYFGMEHPVVGGYTPDKVALRRALSLAVDVEREIQLVRRGQAIPAQSFVGPNTWGYEATFKSEMSEFNRGKARALLDMHGYVDKDGDGWRDLPDGKPLLLEYATQPDQQSRQLIEQWQKNMTAIGVRIEFKPAKWPENLKASRAGKLMMWGVGWSAGTPDADSFQQGAGQPCPVRSAAVQPAARAPTPVARHARACRDHRAAEEAVDRLHAVQSARPPHLHRPDASLGQGLSPQRVRARFLALRGRGHG